MLLTELNCRLSSLTGTRRFQLFRASTCNSKESVAFSGVTCYAVSNLMYMTSYLNDGAPVTDPASAQAAAAAPAPAGTPLVAVEAASAAPAAAVPAQSAPTMTYTQPTWLQQNWKMVAGVSVAVAALCYLKRR